MRLIYPLILIYFFRSSKNSKSKKKSLCEIQASAKIYAKRAKQTPSDRLVEKTRKYLKINGLVAVLFGMSVGFCILGKGIYQNMLSEIFRFKAV